MESEVREEKRKRSRDPIEVLLMSGADGARDSGRREAVTGSLSLMRSAVNQPVEGRQGAPNQGQGREGRRRQG